jgi:hypothetical protein
MGFVKSSFCFWYVVVQIYLQLQIVAALQGNYSVFTPVVIFFTHHTMLSARLRVLGCRLLQQRHKNTPLIFTYKAPTRRSFITAQYVHPVPPEKIKSVFERFQEKLKAYKNVQEVIEGER